MWPPTGSAAALIHEPGEFEHPVVRGAQDKMIRTRLSDSTSVVGESLAAGCGIAVSKLSAPGVDLSDGAGLSIAELDHTHVRKLELARVDDLDHQRFVTTTDRFQRVIPVRIEKVRDHNGKTPAPRRAAASASTKGLGPHIQNQTGQL